MRHLLKEIRETTFVVVMLLIFSVLPGMLLYGVLQLLGLDPMATLSLAGFGTLACFINLCAVEFEFGHE